MKPLKGCAALALVLAVSAGLVGCNEKALVQESYAGVPKDGKRCDEAYKLKANITACVQAYSRH